MDEDEFKRLLYLFPVVRSRDYQVDSESSNQLTSQSGKNEVKQWQDEWNEEGKRDLESQDAFWGKLRSTAEKKVGAADAEKFYNAFRKVYQKLVYEGLSEEAAWCFINSRSPYLLQVDVTSSRK